jgi:predicted dehydrogenase
MKLRIGLVGLGDAWEIRHLPALRALSDRFEVKAVCAEVALRAERAAAEFGATAVDGFRALAAREDIDAVVVLSAEWYGPLPIHAACDAGKAVYCAAALDLPPDQAKQVRARVEKAGIAFMAEFPRRHAPATLRLKELIATRLGKPRLMFCHLRKGSLNKPSSRQMCGMMNRDLLELVDWCRYVVGEKPTSVFGVRHNSLDSGSADYRMMSLDFSDDYRSAVGPMAQISCGQYVPTHWTEAIGFRPPAALQVRCDNGIAFVDLPSALLWFDEAGRHMESLEAERPVGEQLLSIFYRAVTSLVRKSSDLDDAYLALTVVRAAEESFEQGRRVQLSDDLS